MKTYICVKCRKTVCVVSNDGTCKPEECPMGKCSEWHIAGKEQTK